MEPTRDLFFRHSLRCTKQRLALYDALRQCKNHPTAEGLFQMVQPRIDCLSRATVYNTLEALCKAGLAQQLTNANGCCRYDADTSDHLHFRVRNSGEVRDVPPELGTPLLDSLPRAVLDAIERQMHVRIESVTIQLSGIDAFAGRAAPEARDSNGVATPLQRLDGAVAQGLIMPTPVGGKSRASRRGRRVGRHA